MGIRNFNDRENVFLIPKYQFHLRLQTSCCFFNLQKIIVYF